jgi:hypothetical protein
LIVATKLYFEKFGLSYGAPIWKSKVESITVSWFWKASRSCRKAWW